MEKLAGIYFVYGKLCNRKGTQRVYKAANTIIVECVDKLKLQRDNKYHLQCHECLVGDVIFMLKAVKEKIQDTLLVDFKDLVKGALNSLDDDEEQQ